jgi:hypothetical protein
MNTPSTSVSPGLGGFLAFFLLALALWLLMRNMNARLRRMRFRDEEARRQGAVDPTRGGATGAAADHEARVDEAAGEDEAGADEAGPTQPAEPGGSTTAATRGEDDRRPPAQG